MQGVAEDVLAKQVVTLTHQQKSQLLHLRQSYI